jgi:predicted nuclease of restriction endonuclease-like (RecB) superfamily
VGTEWYRVDLLFFHRRLRSLIVVELKLGKFTHADAGYGKPNVMKRAA